jgi:hypothetical protein
VPRGAKLSAVHGPDHAWPDHQQSHNPAPFLDDGTSSRRQRHTPPTADNTGAFRFAS